MPKLTKCLSVAAIVLAAVIGAGCVGPMRAARLFALTGMHALVGTLLDVAGIASTCSLNAGRCSMAVNQRSRLSSPSRSGTRRRKR